jgi:hypothetical protein
MEVEGCRPKKTGTELVARDLKILELRKKDSLDSGGWQHEIIHHFHQAADPDLAETEAAERLLLSIPVHNSLRLAPPTVYMMLM